MHENPGIAWTTTSLGGIRGSKRLQFVIELEGEICLIGSKALDECFPGTERQPRENTAIDHKSSKYLRRPIQTLDFVYLMFVLEK